MSVNPSAPWISLQPQSQRVVPGGTCVMPAGGLGSEPLNYHWEFNSNTLSGASSPTLFLSSVSNENVGAYRLVVSNAYGAAVSSNAIISLVPSLLIGWGLGIFGETTVPTSLSNVTVFAGGWDYSVAVNGDGTITNFGFPEPSFAPNPPGVIALATGSSHILALKNDGTVAAAGITVPPGLSNVISIAAGSGYGLALKQDGTVQGQGTQSAVTNTPVALSNVVAIAGGWVHALALKDDGTVVAWGQNSGGSTNVPDGLHGVAAIAAGWYHNLALKHDGTLVSWGFNFSGQTSVPSLLSNVTAVAGGYGHSLAL